MQRVQAGLPVSQHGHQLAPGQTRLHQHQRALGKPHARPCQLQHCAVVVGPHLALHQDVGLLPCLAKMPLLPGRVVPLAQAGAPAQLIGGGGEPLPCQQGRARHHYVFQLPEGQRHQIVRHLIHGAQGDVILPLTHVDHGVGEVELHLDPRAELGEARQQLAHHGIPRADRAGEAQATTVLLGQGLDVLLHLTGKGKDLPRLHMEGSARLGQAESAGRALEQLGIEGGLQSADVAAQHPLAHPQCIGGGGETAPLHHLVETAQMGDLHPLAPIWKQWVYLKRFFSLFIQLSSTHPNQER